MKKNIKKLQLTKKQLDMIAESEMGKMRKMGVEEIDTMLGDPEDRRIEYPSAGQIEAIKTGEEIPSKQEEIIDPKDMKSPPAELLSYLDKIEEAKSILSKVAAREDNENIKNRIYAHYEKAQKLAFELIKEFGIVH